MAKKQPRIPADLQPWIEARCKFQLSHEHIQMARELGMNPKKLGKLDNHDQEPWKLPLSEFIKTLYFKRFGKGRPDVVRSIEETVAAKEAKKQARKAAAMARARARPGLLSASRCLPSYIGRLSLRSCSAIAVLAQPVKASFVRRWELCRGNWHA